jgi:hypothetical protein
MFGKNTYSGFLGKSFDNKLLGQKGLRVLDEPTVHQGALEEHEKEEKKKPNSLEKFKR